MTDRPDWDYEYDVVVVGSGAGGMTAALSAHEFGLNALVIEKSDLIGGTTAVSAGVIWVPNNPQMSPLEYPDSTQDALTYLKLTVGNDYDEERLSAYVETAPDLVRYLETKTDIVFQAAPLPDYYSNLPGGRDKYRALDPLPINGRKLGAEKKLLRPPHPQIVVAGLMFTTGEVATILRKDRGWLSLMLRQFFSQYVDFPWRLKYKSSPRLTLGNALVARCLISLNKRRIPIWRETALNQLVVDSSGTVTGLTARKGNQTIRIRARRGVILGAGGFSANSEMRKSYLTRAPNTERSVAPDINTGDGILAGQRLGGQTKLMDEAWWIPVYRLKASKLTCGMFMERAFPGGIIVDQAGKRFMNEAADYDQAGRAMANQSENNPPDTPSYFIFDGRFRSHYIAGPLLESPPWADIFLNSETRELLVRAKDISSLAQKIGVEPDALRATIDRFNSQSLTGKDVDFGRGEERYDRHYSDPRVGPNPTMAPIDTAPFYAIPIHAGDIGTKGGLVTDKDARVLGLHGAPISGLYAIGNTSASIMGRSYPGGGVTIGPSMVFGARAAMHIAGKQLNGIEE